MTSTTSTEWPSDADGQVLTRLRDKGFDFSRQHVIDFTIDFAKWPPPHNLIRQIQKEFPNTGEYVDEVSGRGSIVVKVQAMLSYRLVMDTQKRLTDLASEFGGWCESWGVLH